VRTVILLLDHSDEGAAGLVLNRPTEATITDISEQIFGERVEWEKAIHLGGPVPGPLMVVHGDEDLADQRISPGVFSCADSTKIQAIVRSKLDPCVFVAQYAGWGPGQLENEIEADSWLSLPATEEYVFRTDAQELWNLVMKEIRAVTLATMVNLKEIPPDPSMN
jgi:putative transcriptional regulator